MFTCAIKVYKSDWIVCSLAFLFIHFIGFACNAESFGMANVCLFFLFFPSHGCFWTDWQNLYIFLFFCLRRVTNIGFSYMLCRVLSNFVFWAEREHVKSCFSNTKNISTTTLPIPTKLYRMLT